MNATDPAAFGLRPPPSGTRLARASWDDLERVTALYTACEQDRVGEVSIRPDDIRFRWLETGGPGRDTLLVLDEPTDALLAYAEFHEDRDPWTDDLDLFLEGRIDPAATGRGLATFILDRAVERARRAVARSGQAAVLRTTVVDGDDRARAWYERRGFVSVRHFLQMRLDLHEPAPSPTWPSGVTVRTATLDDVEDVWRAHQSAFADLPTALPMELDDWRHERIERDPTIDPALWFLAVADDAVVGICLTRSGTPEAPEVGDIRDLGVVPAWRRRGIAMALLRTALRAFRERGLTGAALEVDDVTLDGAVALYRRAGLRVLRRTDVMELSVPRG